MVYNLNNGYSPKLITRRVIRNHNNVIKVDLVKTGHQRFEIKYFQGKIIETYSFLLVTVSLEDQTYSYKIET